jgi:hypothetical protein
MFGSLAYRAPMHTMPVATTLIESEPAAFAGRAVVAWYWYYFTEARLDYGEVGIH